jgi:aminoglycoside/choline kinase family phosphotransferase
MNFDHNDLEKIEDGLSNKLIYRITEKENTKIIIDFSRDKQEFKNFLTVYEILQKINISIPKIYEVNRKQYKIYMQDFGKNRFNKIYNKDNLYKLLKLAVENIIVIQNESNLNNLKNLKEYTFEDLKIELKEFVTYYIPNNKNSNFPTSKFYESWKSIFYSQNYNMKNFAHKDFEFVNLFFLENCESHLQCGIIDFQSAFKGFIGWDLISLLENPRINFTRDYNDKLIEYFYDNTSIIENFNTFLEQYYVLSLARQTRLLGRWRKLLSTNNDNKYLDYLKITKSRTIATLNNIKNYELRSMYEKYL